MVAKLNILKTTELYTFKMGEFYFNKTNFLN